VNSLTSNPVQPLLFRLPERNNEVPRRGTGAAEQ